jgi:hypothetical protein
MAERAKKAVKKSTLNQNGTKPFHLKATIAPSRADRGAERTGAVEYWWKSPQEFRREVRSPGFHQILVVTGGHESQANEGDYFPEWLREAAVALVEPAPHLEQTLKEMESGEVKRLMGNTYASWMSFSTDGTAKKSIGCSLALTDSTGLIFYGGCTGWGALYKDYKDFHGRQVGRTVESGNPQVTTRVEVLEDLSENSARSFVAPESGGENAIRTVIVDELTMRRKLVTPAAFSWPALKDGSLEGILTTTIVVDRAGNVREVGTIVSDNPALGDYAAKAVQELKFTPYTENGQAVQVISRITTAFKASRPN